MEILLHYIWQNRLLGMPLRLADGQEVHILNSGRHNEDAGPDFTGAVLQIGERKWAGNVEIHIKASDWFRHGHDRNPAYDNIILHVVAVSDTGIYRRNGEEIPQATVNIPANFYHSFASLHNAMKGIRCAPNLSFIPDIRRQDWLETLAFERLQHKGERIISYHNIRSGDWEQAAFITLARALGFGLNGVPFELLAKSLPLTYIYHHADSLQQIEALLFGQAGMLIPAIYPHDIYYQKLVAEYDFLRRKYSLTPISRELWKYSRSRPANFPHRRIAMLAQYLYSGINLTSSLIDARGIYDRLERIFRQDLQQYWANHDSFGGPEVNRSYSLSRASIESLMINVAAPFYFAYARLTGEYLIGEYAIDLLTSIDPERNSIITAWENVGIKADSALRSQALIHLRNEYCDRSRCLECRFGYHILRHDASPPNMNDLSPDARPVHSSGSRVV